MRVVTGPMGAGKSTVLSILEEFGFSVLRADDLAKSFMDDAFYGELNQIFPEVPGPKDMKVQFFKNPRLKSWVEERIHSRVYDALRQRTEDFVEIPLYFESWEVAREEGFIPRSVLYVTMDEKQRHARLKMSRAISDEDIRLRDQYFFQEKTKIEMSDYVLSNDGTIEELKEKVRDYLRCEHLD